MKTATVSTKGRFTIPVELRRKYDIQPGTRIAFKQVGNAVELRPMPLPRSIRSKESSRTSPAKNP